ncbi:MAG: membrane lipoprotein lipid attachment site-containing protein [Bacteroidota bacterium]|nr:membrane lipoprotein lipid attachment site-containing protein [Bacteroidota bacterium]
MKKILLICSAAAVLAACSSNPQSDLDTKKDVIVTDTTKMYNSNTTTDVGVQKVQEPAPAPQVVTQTRTITKTVYVDRTPRQTRNVHQPAQPVNTVPETKPSQTTTTQNTGTAPQSTGTNTSGNGTTSAPTKSAEKENKGWSNAAKDATIGGVGGAIGGAVLSKNKGKGAVIGGIIGAAGGYIIGRKKDKSADTSSNK